MPRGWKRSWVKMWITESLTGSIRYELKADERGCWYDLIIFAGQCRIPGIISANETQEIPRKRLAALLNIPERLLARTILKCKEKDRLKIDEAGLIHIVNWEKYQSESDRVRLWRERKVGPEPAPISDQQEPQTDLTAWNRFR